MSERTGMSEATEVYRGRRAGWFWGTVMTPRPRAFRLNPNGSETYWREFWAAWQRGRRAVGRESRVFR